MIKNILYKPVVKKIRRNKNRLMSVALTLALVFNLLSLALFVSPVSATTVQSAKDTMTRHKVSTLSSHTFVFQLSASETFAATEDVTFKFEAITLGWFVDTGDLTTSNVSFNDGTARTIQAIQDAQGSGLDCTGFNGSNDMVLVFVQDTTYTISFHACDSFTASSAGATVTAIVGTAAGGGVDVISNSSSGSKEIAVDSAFGDANFEIDVPIMDDDQVSISSTVDTFIAFDLDIDEQANTGASHDESAAPYAIDLQELNFSTVTDEDTTSVEEIYINIDTNADDGAVIAVASANNALSSASSGDTIPMVTATLATDSVDGGYGLAADQQASLSQGQLNAVSPFNVFSTGGGVAKTTSAGTFTEIFNTTGQIVVGGDGVVAVRAVAGKSTSAADDYTDTLTFRATATY